MALGKIDWGVMADVPESIRHRSRSRPPAKSAWCGAHGRGRRSPCGTWRPRPQSVLIIALTVAVVLVASGRRDGGQVADARHDAVAKAVRWWS